MESILLWGLDFIRAVQTIASPPLTVFMKIITSFGGEPMYMALLPLFFWCVDEKKGLHLGFTVLISAWINMALKYLLDQPRPFFEGYDPSVGMISERMGGLPSGHAQNTLVMFFLLAFWIKKNWAYVSAAVLCLLISFSRIYLGVHFPTDIIAGWILGGIVLCVYKFFIDKIEVFFAKGGYRAGMIASALVSFLLILYLPSRSLLMPGGVLFGFGIGYCLNRIYVGFTTNSFLGRTGVLKYLTICTRMVLGIAGFLLIFVGADSLIPQDSPNQRLFIFMQLALTGLWVSVAAPWLFIKLRLAETELKKNES